MMRNSPILFQIAISCLFILCYSYFVLVGCIRCCIVIAIAYSDNNVILDSITPNYVYIYILYSIEKKNYYSENCILAVKLFRYMQNICPFQQ